MKTDFDDALHWCIKKITGYDLSSIWIRCLLYLVIIVGSALILGWAKQAEFI